ncbi:odorant receptor 67a-like [Condylostylus longicornis]|uniref:odorant receptor 67a-like n=1 Tax=Condylostylus longicornis TaxID=2530218 RepID=UPI00244E4958|nr:odorant receptor 67a-like [Condylostylus longicornis]
MRIFEIIGELVGLQMFMQYITTATSLAFLSVYFLQIKTNSEMTSLILIYVAFLQQIFLTSFFAEMLKTESENLTNSLYSTDWISKDKKFHKILMIFMEMSQKDFSMNAAWMPVNLNFFMQASIINSIE